MDSITSEIQIISSVWRSQVKFVKGYYEFEILKTEKNSSHHTVSQITIYRRFSDIELLYEGLIKYNPGCIIIKIPEKSFWYNLPVNNDTGLSLRKQQIEDYLNYINKHKYLSKNPVYLIFISDDFERYKADMKEGENIYDVCKRTFNRCMNYTDTLTFHISISDESLKNEKQRLEKIESGVASTVDFLKKAITQSKAKADSLTKLSSITKIIQSSNIKLELKGIENDFVVMKKKNLGNDYECFEYLLTKCELLTSGMEGIFDSLVKYQSFLSALIEIFDRKENVEFVLKRAKNDDFSIGDNKQNELVDMEFQVQQMHSQFAEELSNFHQNTEGNYVEIMKKFFKLKETNENEIRKVFKREYFDVKAKGTLQINIEDHF